jgi:hypothetical protein
MIEDYLSDEVVITWRPWVELETEDGKALATYQTLRRI